MRLQRSNSQPASGPASQWGRVCKVVRVECAAWGYTHLEEDIVSEVMLHLVERWDRYDRAKSARSTWVGTVARNKARDLLRQAERERVNQEDLTRAANGRGAVRAGRAEELGAAMAHIQAMGEPEDVVTLAAARAEGLTWEEAGALCGISAEAARKRHDRCLLRLLAH